MPIYACHDGNLFTITVNAASKTEAEAITGLSAVKTVYKKPWASWTIQNGIYKSPQPFLSWEWNGQDWQPPIPKPIEEEGLYYYWNEPSLSWKIVEQDQPYPSWIIDDKNGNWIAPKPKPQNYDVVVNADGSTSIIESNSEYSWDESIEDWKLVN